MYSIEQSTWKNFMKLHLFQINKSNNFFKKGGRAGMATIIHLFSIIFYHLGSSIT